MKSMINQQWLPTTAAAFALGFSPATLKRARDISGGFLEGGRHYNFGPSRNSSIIWNVEAVRAAFHRRGIQARKNTRD